MIGRLPKALEIDGISYPINSDFRAALLIFQAFGDVELSPINKQLVLLEIIYTPIGEDKPNIPANTEDAIKQAMWFLDVGLEHKKDSPKTMDYTQDEQLIFSAVNAVYTKDVREDEYMHWWTFYGLCQAINNESLLAQIVNIRTKKAKGEKLEKYEQKFYAENRNLIDFRMSQSQYDAMIEQLRG